MEITVSILNQDDRQQWEALYHAYAEFYQMPMNKDILNTVWSWIMDDTNPFFALAAKNKEGILLGFAHCRAMPSPLRGTMVGFLDDLYVKPQYRGTGCVQKLYAALKNLARENNWQFIRWITQENNYRARASYDKIAEKTTWLTYQMKTKN